MGGQKNRWGVEKIGGGVKKIGGPSAIKQKHVYSVFHSFEAFSSQMFCAKVTLQTL